MPVQLLYILKMFKIKYLWLLPKKIKCISFGMPLQYLFDFIQPFPLFSAYLNEIVALYTNVRACCRCLQLLLRFTNALLVPVAVKREEVAFAATVSRSGAVSLLTPTMCRVEIQPAAFSQQLTVGSYSFG